jgi:hypothetical protein
MLIDDLRRSGGTISADEIKTALAKAGPLAVGEEEVGSSAAGYRTGDLTSEYSMSQGDLTSFLKLARTPYTGGEDLLGWLENFEQDARSFGISDYGKARGFARWLKDAPQRLLASMPEEDQQSGAKITKRLIKRFLSERKLEQLIEGVLSAKQKPNESVRDYIERFQKMVWVVQSVSQKLTKEMVIHRMINGLEIGTQKQFKLHRMDD